MSLANEVVEVVVPESVLVGLRADGERVIEVEGGKADKAVLGCVCRWGVIKALTGGESTYRAWLSRLGQDVYRGGGDDIPGFNVAINGQRLVGVDPLRYQLMVDENERKENWAHILAVAGRCKGGAVRVSVVGWAMDYELKKKSSDRGGAWSIGMSDLRPVQRLVRFMDWRSSHYEVQSFGRPGAGATEAGEDREWQIRKMDTVLHD